MSPCGLGERESDGELPGLRIVEEAIQISTTDNTVNKDVGSLPSEYAILLPSSVMWFVPLLFPWLLISSSTYLPHSFVTYIPSQSSVMNYFLLMMIAE